MYLRYALIHTHKIFRSVNVLLLFCFILFYFIFLKFSALICTCSLPVSEYRLSYRVAYCRLYIFVFVSYDIYDMCIVYVNSNVV